MTLLEAIQLARLVRDAIAEYQRQHPGAYPDDETLKQAIRDKAAAYLDEGAQWKASKERDVSGRSVDDSS